MLNGERFADMAPAAVYATLLDEGVYLCSESTMYRLLRERGQTGDRRRHATHPASVKPELIAHQPNSAWSWDITKLRGPAKWSYYYLYVILDNFSRYVVGWMVASRESKILAERLIAQTLATQHITAGQLTLHADRGSSMSSKPVALLLADLGRHQVALTATHQQRQPVLRGPVQDPEIPARLPATIRVDRGRPSALRPLLRLVQPNTNIPASGCMCPPTCTTAVPTRSTGTGPPCSTPPSASCASHPNHPPCRPSAPSTHHSRRTNRLPNPPEIVSQKG